MIINGLIKFIEFFATKMQAQPPGFPGQNPPPIYPNLNQPAPGFNGQQGQPPMPGYNQVQPLPVFQQPGMPLPGAPVTWMAPPTLLGSVPPGLEYLAQINQLVVQQKVELLEAIVGFETANKYEVKNSLGQLIYYAKEENDCCTRQCCGAQRPFQMSMTNNAGVEVMRIDRPLRCQGCCCFCCLQELTVTVGGTETGYLKQQCSLLRPVYSVLDQSGEEVLQIRGPVCTDFCCGNVEFDVLSVDGTEVGKIVKNFSGFLKEIFTDADTFSVSFPVDLDVKVKATLLAAVFLIDFMYFENNEPNRDNQLLH